ncbi:unnamed protein product [Brugia timori]|uniref:Uncharacterized protein n=1 Tax=Brugia timori TaxID=42155 RepID=A0A3P7UIL4_9BILA|nr:unnamed protein product [Brugia timori]
MRSVNNSPATSGLAVTLFPDDELPVVEPFLRTGSRLTSSATVGKAKFERHTGKSMLKFCKFQSVDKE